MPKYYIINRNARRYRWMMGYDEISGSEYIPGINPIMTQCKSDAKIMGWGEARAFIKNFGDPFEIRVASAKKGL